MSLVKPPKYICDICHYETNNKANYFKHELTTKHKQNVENIKSEEKTREHFPCQNYNNKPNRYNSM